MPFSASENDYDWLGSGIYFWEANPLRGLEFARELQRRPRSGSKITEPYVVGAAIDYGFCLDLLSSAGVEAVAAAYENYRQVSEAAGTQMPENSVGEDLLKRNLDCAVINHLHGLRAAGTLDPFDTVKGAFREGKPLYENSGFYRKTHVQICVRNPICIKGVFRVRPEDLIAATAGQ